MSRSFWRAFPSFRETPPPGRGSPWRRCCRGQARESSRRRRVRNSSQLRSVFAIPVETAAGSRCGQTRRRRESRSAVVSHDGKGGGSRHWPRKPVLESTIPGPGTRRVAPACRAAGRRTRHAACAKVHSWGRARARPRQRRGRLEVELVEHRRVGLRHPPPWSAGPVPAADRAR